MMLHHRIPHCHLSSTLVLKLGMKVSGLWGSRTASGGRKAVQAPVNRAENGPRPHDLHQKGEEDGDGPQDQTRAAVLREEEFTDVKVSPSGRFGGCWFPRMKRRKTGPCVLKV